MTSARMSALANLRGSIERIEAQSGSSSLARAALGHAEADDVLQGGLALGAVHEDVDVTVQVAVERVRAGGRVIARRNFLRVAELVHVPRAERCA